MSVLETHVLTGLLSERAWGDADYILYCGDVPVAEWAAEVFERSLAQVSVRYWTASEEATVEAIKEAAVLALFTGPGGAVLETRYSDVTGYLWTDEELQVGGHDVMRELRSHIGKFLHLEIDIHDRAKP